MTCRRSLQRSLIRGIATAAALAFIVPVSAQDKAKIDAGEAEVAVRIVLVDPEAVLRGEVTETAIALKDLYPNTDAVVDELRRKAVAHEERGWFTQLLTDDGKIGRAHV